MGVGFFMEIEVIGLFMCAMNFRSDCLIMDIQIVLIFSDFLDYIRPTWAILVIFLVRIRIFAYFIKILR